MASAIAYRLFLWLLPFCLVLAALLGFAHAASPNTAGELAEHLGFSGYVPSTVTQAAAQAEQSRWIMLVIGLWGLYWASSAAAKTFAAVHRLVWDLPVRRRRRTVKGALAFAGLALLLLTIPVLTSLARSKLSAAAAVGITLAAFAGYAAAWLWASWLLPHGDASWTSLVPGAVCWGAGTQILHVITAFFLANKIASASQLYGGLGAAATILLWLYLIGRLVVAAAVINSTLWERTHGGITDEPVPVA
jgi:uncharacterized BrkB/YihY/UPF0761 family membrane protein